jgi:hypothetical protein
MASGKGRKDAFEIPLHEIIMAGSFESNLI